MSEKSMNRALELGNELADVLIAKRYNVSPLMRSELCNQFMTMLPVLYSESPDIDRARLNALKECAEIARKRAQGYARYSGSKMTNIAEQNSAAIHNTIEELIHLEDNQQTRLT